jgi:hypothetical protein
MAWQRHKNLELKANFGKFRILILKSMSQKEMILLIRTLLKYDIYLSDLSDTYFKK